MSEMPPLTERAPEDPAVRALGLSQSARPGAAALSLEYEHLVRMREGHFYRPKADPSEARRNWNELSISEAAWIRLEEVGVINKGRSWTSRIGLDEDGEPVKPDLPYVILTKLVIASSPRKMLTLNQIYQAMEERWPYFRVLGQTFRNSIRHNLSMNPAFVNVERPLSEGVGAGKGGYWRVSEDKTTSHRGRAKKARVGARQANRNSSAPFLIPAQSKSASVTTQPDPFAQHPAYVPYAQPFPPAAPLAVLAGQAYHPLPSASQHGPGDYAPLTPAPPPPAESSNIRAPQPQMPRVPAARRRLSHAAKGKAAERELEDAAGVEAIALLEMANGSIPVSVSALPLPSSSSSSIPSALSVPSPFDDPTRSETTPATASPPPFRYPGLTLQRQESFVRGSGPDLSIGGELPTPPSERSSLQSSSKYCFGFSRQYASFSLSTEREREPPKPPGETTKLPGIAALLAPISPDLSPSVTSPRPTEAPAALL